MRNFKTIALGLWLCVAFLAPSPAATFEYADGTKVEGEIVQGKPEVLKIRIGDNQYKDIPWEKLSQNTLKQLAADPKHKLDLFIQPFLEPTEEEKIKKTDFDLKPVPRLERPAKGSLLGSMFGSSVGLVVMLLLYAANIYAGYEIATVRAYPAAMVCGIAAVAPVVGPIVFLCMPTKLKSSVELDHLAEEAPPADSSPLAPETPPGEAGAAAAHPGGLHLAHEAPAEAAAAAPPPPQIFKRGQYTFNRRFIETKFGGFFGMVRHGPEKDLVLLIKSARGEFIATRISRIAANDLHVDVHKGGASQEVQIPFLEIQEIQIKHKDA